MSYRMDVMLASMKTILISLGISTGLPGALSMINNILKGIFLYSLRSKSQW
jgi:hypothetical protein